MHVLVTGASGFIGQELALALVSTPSITHLTLTDVVRPSNPSPAKDHHVQISCVQADLTSRGACVELFTANLDVLFLLHGIMSGAAEADLELGLRVNFDSTRQILDVVRKVKPGVKVVYPSSLAVYGPLEPGRYVNEQTAPLPGSSYGAQKLMCETLLQDYTRRGLIDALILRLPTVVVRPGRPSGAASSFASGIIREPLKGERSVLPVSRELKMWICSPRTVVKNMILAIDIPTETFENLSRAVNLPGITVSVADLLEALRVVGGEEKLRLVEEKLDPDIDNIVANWPACFSTRWAKALGFVDDGTLVETVKTYVDDFGSKAN
ncbi:MAG: hypothetical protein M1830_005562 [Pleopsidium flavum]|nr:MAG: hypothetical protein M1830_005562 [Pleopsidium flavum]